MGLGRILAELFYIKKRDPNVPISRNMKLMRGMDRISLFMFLAIVIALLIKVFFFRKH